MTFNSNLYWIILISVLLFVLLERECVNFNKVHLLQFLGQALGPASMHIPSKRERKKREHRGRKWEREAPKAKEGSIKCHKILLSLKVSKEWHNIPIELAKDFAYFFATYFWIIEKLPGCWAPGCKFFVWTSRGTYENKRSN